MGIYRNIDTYVHIYTYVYIYRDWTSDKREENSRMRVLAQPRLGNGYLAQRTFPLQNGSNQGQNLDLTVSFMPIFCPFP